MVNPGTPVKPVRFVSFGFPCQVRFLRFPVPGFVFFRLAVAQRRIKITDDPVERVGNQSAPLLELDSLPDPRRRHDRFAEVRNGDLENCQAAACRVCRLCALERRRSPTAQRPAQRADERATSRPIGNVGPGKR
jgi:hypothetical protein